jgi:hypothetical protein
MTFLDRGADVEALRTDRYLDSLLAVDGPSAPATDPAGPGVGQAIHDAANLLRRLGPIHPSFRFEERLATRLAETARTMRLANAAGSEGAAIPLAALPPPDDLLDDPADDLASRTRPLIIGGALTSAALSIAGAAFVAWRRARVPRGMARLDRTLD